MDPLTTINTRRTPQSRQADPRQRVNAAGGFVFIVDDVVRLKRFLTLGTDGGTYYAKAPDLTADNAKALFRMVEADPKLLIDTIVDVSVRGAAPKQNPAIFALAVAASHGDEQAYALAQLSKVCRTGTHLFLFARYVEQFRGWGRALRRAVGDWYLSKTPDQAAFQAVKYRQREGWSHRDLLRLAHPSTLDPTMRATFDWIVRNATSDEAPAIIQAFTRAHEPGADVAAIVRDSDLSWEMLPDEALTRVDVWDALLDRGMPQAALMRQLPRLTRLGLLPRTGGRTAEIAARLADSERLRTARVHPVNALIAQRTYAAGKSVRGDSVWTPTTWIVDALDAAFYNAFGAVQPAGKRTMLALDVSGSMTASVSGLPISCREASTALTLVQMATERECDVVAFTGDSRVGWMHSEVNPLSISPRQRLDDAIRTVSNLPFSGTDCALPMQYALKNHQEIDTFVIYTDNETWSGEIHPHQALVEYREQMGIPARLIVVGMTATEFSIADPSDAGMLDVAGFDSAVPNLIADFSRGF